MIKPRKIRWAGFVASMEEKECIQRFDKEV
jgi:hypothetical protein